MGNVIKFPEGNAKVKNVRGRLNPTFFKNAAILGLGVLFLFALAINFTFQDQRTNSRDLANFQDGFDGSRLDDYILKSLNSSDTGTEIVYSRKPNQEDKLIFETLMGSYDIIKVNDRIAQIYLKPGYSSLKATSLPSVLSQYRKAIGFENIEYKLQNPNSENRVYSYDLLSQGKSIGVLKVTLDEDNQIVSLNSKFN